MHIRRTHLGLNDAPEIDRLLIDESGETAIEYGLIASGIAVALIAAVKGVGTNLKTTFGSISTAVK